MKIICGILAVCMLFCLTACGNTAGDGNKAEAADIPENAAVSTEETPVSSDETAAAQEDETAETPENTADSETDPVTETEPTGPETENDSAADYEPAADDETKTEPEPIVLPEIGDDDDAIILPEIVIPTEPDEKPEPNVETDPFGEGSDVELPEIEAPDSPAQEDPAPAATLEDALRFIDQDVSALYAAIGRPNSSSYEESCMGDGDDGILYYDDFIVFTYREPDKSAETVIDAE